MAESYKVKVGEAKFCSRACYDASGRPSRWPSSRERLWANVPMPDDPNACWLRPGAANAGGYTVIHAEGRNWLAHRYAWHVERGPIPPGLFVCHRCDVRYPPGDLTYRRCIRPSHLFLGTVADNQRDMVAKRRQATGDRHGSRTQPGDHWSKRMPERVTRHEAHGMAKLTADDVREIRRLGDSVTPTELGRRFGVTRQNVNRILKGQTWLDA